MKARVGIGVVLVLLLAGSPAMGDVLFSESIDNLAYGAMPANGSAGTNGGTWYVEPYNKGTITVVDDPTSEGHGKVIQLADNSISGVTRFGLNLDNGGTKEQVTFGYDICFASNINKVATMIYGSAGLASYTYVNLPTTAYDSVVFGPGYANQVILSDNSLPLGVWYRFEMTMPATTEVPAPTAMDVKIIHLASGQSSTFTVNAFGSLSDVAYSTMWFTQASTVDDAGTYYIDNISVETVPEPATLALTGIGAVGMLLRRKR